jgi:DNA-binding CsgD family transcriptional regulator
LLGGALSDQNRADEALDALRTARSLPGPERLRASIAADEAGVLSHQLGRLAEGERVLSETLEELSDPEARALVEGARAAILVSTGNATTGEPAPVTSGVPTAVLAAVIEHATAGRLDLAVQLASECLTAAGEWSDEFAAIELFLQLTEAWALVLRGDLRDAQARADAAYADALEHRSDFPRVTWSFVRGIVFVARGLPNSASHALREAIGGFELADRGFLRPSHAYLAMATALAGDGAASERHVRAAHDAKSSFEGLFAVDLGRASAWSSAARRELTTAATEAKRAAEHAAERHAYALEVLALHDAARFGRPADVVDRIETLTTLVDGALAPCVADHVRALVDSDGAALDEASHSFSALTLDLFAAEASAAAARAHRRAGRRSSAFASLERARELTARCESPQTPTLEWADQPEDLTAREREIAELAAADMPSREIAERLGITTRTVDNLLGRVYAKFGISGRHELADLLGTRPST